MKFNVEKEEFIKEVEDEIRRLNKQPTTLQLCQDAMDLHRQEPTQQTIEQLRVTYEAVPKNLKKYLGDMDSKDWEFKQALGVT